KTADNLRAWNEKELLKELYEHPENFSPNVLLRPLYQESILPNVAYVGGPGELAYWLQLRTLFQACKIPMPALVLRDSAIVISAAARKRMSKMGLNAGDVLRDKQDLIAVLAGKKPEFTEEKDELLMLYKRLAERMEMIDATLKATALAEAQRVLSGIDHLQAKAWKAIKIREE
ncbi:MAG: bacillithiol biosynthesis BshC, partial [Flavobacteriales bacterium]